MNDEVLNQPPPLEGYDAYAADPWLKAAVRRAGVPSSLPVITMLPSKPVP